MEFNLKKCTHCRIEKSINDFYSKGDRFSSRCKQCEKILKKRKRLEKKKKKKTLSKRRESTKMIDVLTFQVNLKGTISENCLEELVEELIKDAA